MSVSGLDSVIGKLKLFIDEAKGDRTEKAITEMLIIGGSNASFLTPIDSSNLINSQGRQTFPTAKGMGGAVYYGAYYAGYVNFASGKLKGRLRAGVESFTAYKGSQQEKRAFASDVGNFWDPQAEPHFLEKGMEQMANDANEILAKHYRV